MRVAVRRSTIDLQTPRGIFIRSHFRFAITPTTAPTDVLSPTGTLKLVAGHSLVMCSMFSQVKWNNTTESSHRKAESQKAKQNLKSVDNSNHALVLFKANAKHSIPPAWRRRVMATTQILSWG